MFFPTIHVVVGLGSTDNVFWTTFCLRKSRLEQTSKRSYVLLLHVPVYIYGVLLQGVPARILIRIYS